MSIVCGSQVCICDLPIRFDTYRGCSHACRYCFAKKKTDISNIKPDNCLAQLLSFIDGRRVQSTNWCDWKIPLHWGGMSDPFQPCEKIYKISLQALKIFAETRYPFVVSTKGRIIVEDEYLELIKRCNCVVQISAVCESYDKLEQGAPSFAERLEMIRKLSKTGKRVIVRIQPYMTEVHAEVLQSIGKFAAAGAYGVTVEGMKFAKQQKGLIKLGNDWVYPKYVLEPKFAQIKRRCYAAGIKFYCAENRLRTLGDSMTCCGCEGVEGFKVNRFNLEHILNGEDVVPTQKMQEKGTAIAFTSVCQNAGANIFLKQHSFSDYMRSGQLIRGFTPIVLAPFERETSPEKRLEFTLWLRSTGITRKEVDEITGTQMSSHWLCGKLDGQTEIPTPEQFAKIKQHPKIKEIPDYIVKLVYGRAAKQTEILKAFANKRKEADE